MVEYNSMMSQTESLFNPQDDSLSEKVRAYYAVCRDYSRVQASLKQTKQGKNINYVGDHDEVLSAYELISKSLHYASSKVSDSDLQKAREQNLISDKQLAEIVQINRQYEIALTRQQQTPSNSDNLRQRR